MTAHDPRVTLTEVLAAHAWRPMMHSQTCSCGWHASLSHPDLHRAHLAERIEEQIAARLAPIRALAEQWDTGCAREVLAALDATGADLSASQDHDGAEGQGEGEKALTPGREVRFGVVLDDQGSTDEYDTCEEARTALDKWGGDGIVRIERTVALWLEETR